MDKSVQILSDITVFLKYAKYIKSFGRRETWEELVTRNKEMHLRRFPELSNEIESAYELVYEKKILPSMRSLQFAGKPIEINNSRIFNCAYTPIDDWRVFSEVMFLLLGGTGVGFSVQKRHIEKLPEIRKPTRNRRYLVGDSIEGWADAIKVLIKAYLNNGSLPKFDFSDIREKGAELVTSGGKAPGPEPLKDCVHNIQKILDRKQNGEKLTSLEIHDIICYIADCVLSGGIRRAALISFFDIDDEEMLTCKYGNWWELNPQRGRANNSAVVVRHKLKRNKFFELWDKIKNSGSGDPGFYLTNNPDMLGNPCQPASAPILTKNGVKTFGELNIGDEIWSETGWTKVINKWSTGIKHVYKYRTTSGVFYGTQNHRIVSGGEKIDAGSAESIDILTGPYYDEVDLDPQDIMDGIVFGDGSVHKASNNLVHLCIGKDDYDYFNSEISHLITKKRPGLSDTAHEIQTTIKYEELDYTYNRIIPDRFMYGDRNKVCGFLRGLFTANGGISGDRVTLKASSSKVIEQVQILLSSLGIRSYYTTNKSKVIRWKNGDYQSKESYDVNITADRSKFFNIIGFIQKYKMERLEQICNKIGKSDKPGKVTYDINAEIFVSEEEVFDITVDNKPHTYWTGGCNVSNCAEASLRDNFCNLVTINASNIINQTDLNNRAKAASLISTLQSSYTDFHYLRDKWKRNTEKEALLGVSMTGIASRKVLSLNLSEAALVVNEENERIAKIIGVNKAARTTLLKPEGTASLVCGSSSGIHAWHAKYYIRRVRVGKNESIYKYLSENHPELIEDDYFKPTTQAVISVPQKAPDDAILRDESPIDLLERVKKFTSEWIKPAHRSGDNTHSVSCTVSVKDDEWDLVGNWMWSNIEFYNCISVLPYWGGSHKQSPFEDITEERYHEMMKTLKDVDLTRVVELEDNTDHKEQVACVGGACSIE